MSAVANRAAKQVVQGLWRALQPGCDPVAALAAHAHPDLRFLGFHPVNELDGPERVALDFLAPLLTAFPDLLRRPYICCAGQHNNATWVATTGDFVGSFIQDWLGIPASGRSVHMRFAEFCRIEDGRVREIMLLINLISLMRQCGHQAMPPESGDTRWIPGLHAGDGMHLDHVDPADSVRSLDLVLAMVDALNEYDGANLASMSMTASGRKTCAGMARRASARPSAWGASSNITRFLSCAPFRTASAARKTLSGSRRATTSPAPASRPCT